MWQCNLTCLLPVMLAMTLSTAGCSGEQPAPLVSANWWHTAAGRMVEEQIQMRGVTDNQLLQAMRQTPRHLFVPSHLQQYAYRDGPLPIGQEQTISQPYIVGLMSELLQLNGTEKVLEIGTGSGYQAAILAQLAAEVYTIEILQSLADSSRARLSRLGYDNAEVRWGDGYRGWPEQAPFERIIVTAAPEVVPPALVEQLAPGGIMVLPVGDYYQELRVIRKDLAGEISQQSIIPVRFVPMVHPGE